MGFADRTRSTIRCYKLAARPPNSSTDKVKMIKVLLSRYNFKSHKITYQMMHKLSKLSLVTSILLHFLKWIERVLFANPIPQK